jgi:hypothetical protein
MGVTRFLTFTRTLVAVLGCVLLYTACSHSATGPKAGDPTVLVTNEVANSPLYFTWRDGQGVVGADTIPGGTIGRCERFTARADSAYFHDSISDAASASGNYSTYTAPWFDPAARPAFTMVVTSGAPYGGPQILVRDTTAGC